VQISAGQLNSSSQLKQFRARLEVHGIFPRREPGTGHKGYQGLRLQTSMDTNQWHM
jgi:hypothetical protein